MMAPAAESPYRAHRRAFIAACEAAGVDAIARVHPARGADGKPLFMDSAAMGPRHAPRAVLLASGDAAGSQILSELVRSGARPPPEARLVLVHALDPAAFAGVPGDANWSRKMLGAVATEDLAKVKTLAILSLGGAGETLQSAVAEALPESNINVMLAAADMNEVRRALAAFYGAPSAE
jgi:hypothetical protein